MITVNSENHHTHTHMERNRNLESPIITKDQQVAWIGSSLADAFSFSLDSSFLSTSAVTFSLGLAAVLRANAFTFGLSSTNAFDFTFSSSSSLTAIAFFIASTKSLSSLADFDPEELDDDELIDDAVDDVWSDHFEDWRDKRRNFLSPMV